jgi:AraC-like DNA-binding protein/ligand-binding sensor protein
LERYIETCTHFAVVSGIGAGLLDADGMMLYQTPMSCGRVGFCEALGLHGNPNCEMTPHYGCSQARRFGGRYIFFCHLGLVHLASPVMNMGELQCALFAGPFLLVEHEEYRQGDLRQRFPDAMPDDIQAHLAEIPVLSPERVHALSEILFYTTSYLGMQVGDSALDLLRNQPLPSVITEYIERIQDKAGFYPLQQEDELLAAMATGDVIAAKTLLNELLGYIFFYSGFQFDVIRSRVLELIVLLSRAAVKGGADAELIFGLNYEYLKEIGKFNNIEDLAYWLSAIMNRFTDHVFHFGDVKHADVIFKAVNYIKAHYMKKITLDDVSKAVYLSPAYFSRVFKEETGYNFTGYLNKTRIEESKKLLRNARVNLSDIAGMVGYEDQSYFSKVFKKLTGMSPLRFRQSRGH